MTEIVVLKETPLAHANLGMDMLFREEHPQTPGEAIRYWRQAAGISQNNLAMQLGMTQPQVSAMERGDRHVGLKVIRRIAIILNVHPSLIAFPDLVDWD